MIERYADQQITQIFSDRNKTTLWDETELAVIEASRNLGRFPRVVYDVISKALKANPVDLEWWKQRDGVIHHDLNAYIEERQRSIPPHLQRFFHQDMTSFDTEEPAFARMLNAAVNVVWEHLDKLEGVLVPLARRHRHSAMIGRTHGQGGDCESFGKRVLTWIKDLRTARTSLRDASVYLRYSKLSGAMGNYGGIPPEVEREALKILGLVPYVGATQIMPRVLYAPVATALCGIVLVIHKIGIDIRLMARSPKPICQEPFAKKQKGSSAMPHKKNPINTEQLEGMARMAQGFNAMIMQNVPTWEERAIEQSSVERVAWPDLFHVTVRALTVLTKVVSGLKVYPDNMLWELVESRGCYAASRVKEVLKEMGGDRWNDAEEAYRLVQLAAFNVFEPSDWARQMREMPRDSFSFADQFLFKPESLERPYETIREVIAEGRLRVSEELEASAEHVERWNGILGEIFAVPENRQRWEEYFNLSVLLEHESHLFREILGE